MGAAIRFKKKIKVFRIQILACYKHEEVNSKVHFSHRKPGTIKLLFGRELHGLKECAALSKHGASSE